MALWNAGQQRVARERQARLAEAFTASRDAGLDVLVTSGQAKPVGTWRQPPYVRAERSSAPVLRTPAARDATLARLAALIPGIVKVQ